MASPAENTSRSPGQSNASPGRGATRMARRAAVAASIGNILEWYDFAVYGYLATIIATQFFPAANPVSALLSSFAVFGIGFVARPLGGLLIGRVADRKGRKPALMLTIGMMASGTLMIGLIPGYASIGLVAPCLLVVARLLQGFSAGGEWGTATTFLVEWAPEGRRGFYGSFQQSTVMLGLVLGSGIAAFFSTVLSSGAMDAWGWRIPFILGAILGPFGIYMRRNVEETPVFNSLQQKSKFQYGPSVRLFGLVAVPFAVIFTFMSYLPTFTQKYGGLSRSEALWSNTLALMVLAICIPIAGIASDRIGRKPMLVAANLGFFFLSYPLLMATLKHPGFGTVLAVQIVFSLLYATYAGAAAAAYVELFDSATRMTCLSTSYNLSGIVFGAFAAYIATWLINAVGSPIAIVYFVLAATIVSGASMIGMRETAHQPLR